MTPAAPSQDEFDSWRLHPVTLFVAEAYRIAADRQRDEWAKQFDARLIPADIHLTRLELKTREDAYRAFLETTLADYMAIVAPSETGTAHGRGPTSQRQARRSSPAGR